MSAVPQRKMTAPPSNQRPATPQFEIISGVTSETFNCGIYGPEGVGKSCLASLCPGARFADIEGSMNEIDCQKIKGAVEWNWEQFLLWIESLNNCIAGIDSVTRAEDLAALYVIEQKTSNDGTKAKDSLEDFKYKAGMRFVNDEFKKMLSAISRANRRKVSFIMVAHNRVKRYKDPEGSDYLRNEPFLQDSDEYSNMRTWVQFLKVCAFVDLDKLVERRKVTKEGGTRTIYLETSLKHISKARGIDNSQINFKYDPETGTGTMDLWERLGVK